MTARPQDAHDFADHGADLGLGDVLDRLSAVHEVERLVGVSRQIRHRVVAVAHRSPPRVHDRVFGGAIHRMAFVGRQVDDRERLEFVRIPHRHQRTLGVVHVTAADVEDRACGRQTHDELAAAHVQGVRQRRLLEGNPEPELDGPAQPLHELVARQGSRLQRGKHLGGLRGGRVTVQDDVERRAEELFRRHLAERERGRSGPHAGRTPARLGDQRLQGRRPAHERS